MFTLIQKLFIKDYQQTDDPIVRERYGAVFSYVSIFLNTILVIFKLIVSFLTNSISIRADAFNNLSDVASNVATLFGFKLSNKHADADHPYGHGRMEYISGLIVAFLILSVGLTSIKDSILKIFNPEELVFSSVAIIVLIGSIIIKLLMCYLNKKAGNIIDSDTLKAAGQDSLNDSFSTLATLISLLVVKFFNINIDAYMGGAISILVLMSGVGIFKDITGTILGKAPDKELIKKIEKTILAHEEIHGIHDLMMHDYGPSAQFMTLHVEVDANESSIDTHDTIDNIEVEIYKTYGIVTTIHMDPIDYTDTEAEKLHKLVDEKIALVNEKYSIHDFRVVRGKTHTNLVFDCVIPSGDRTPHSDVAKTIREEVSKIPGGPYFCVITVEHSYLD